MIGTGLCVILIIQLYLVKLTIGNPIKINDFGNVTTRQEFLQHYETLQSLVNSKVNKKYFGQLSSSATTTSDEDFYDMDHNLMGTIKFNPFNQFQRQPYVANGYIGSRIPNLGQGFSYDQQTNDNESENNLLQGWPMFNKRYAGAFVAGFFNVQKNTTKTNFPELLDNGYESIIAAIPQWTSLSISTTIDNNAYSLDPNLSLQQYGNITHYSQTMSLNNGIVTTQFIWLNTFSIKYEIIAHRQHVNLGVVRLTINNLNDTDSTLTIKDSLDFATSQRCQLINANIDDDGIFINFQPSGIDYINGSIYSTLHTNLNIDSNKTTTTNVSSQEITTTIKGNSMIDFSKFVGIATTDFDPANFHTSNDVLNYAKKVSTSFDEDSNDLIQNHIISWDKTLESTGTITFPDDPLLTLTSRSSLFHLTANTRPHAEGVTAALSVGGLSSDSYAGLVFWDTDLWMLNGLLPFIPHHAKSLVNYRLHTHDQAKKNLPEGYDGAVYPWTSGRFGNCTATGPCMDYEYHINVAVPFAAWNIYLSGNGDDDYLKNVALPLMFDAGEFFSDYVKYNDTLNQYTTSNLTDPDEYANHVDNGAYTNAGISLLMKYAIDIGKHLNEEIPGNFTNIVNNVHLPASNSSIDSNNMESDQDITLEYTGMNSSVGVKQADVIMVTYPLQNELISEAQAIANMHFYAMKQVSYGPAMTFPIFSIVSSSLSTSGCSSQSYLHKAIQPFLRSPFGQFSEQNNDNYETNGGTNPAFPFLTGHGGFLQSILQGLIGLRFDYEIDNDGKIQRMLKLDPTELPLLPNGVEFNGIKYMNQTISLKVDDSNLTIKHNGAYINNDEMKIMIKIGDRNEKSGKYELDPHDSLTVPLFKLSQAVENSISECGLAKFINITDGVNGDSSYLINDGDNFTHWQPVSNSTTTKILVDLKDFNNITFGEINWGDKPPTSWSLSTYKLNNDWDSDEILATVDFGNDLHSKFQYFRNDGDNVIHQDDAFTNVISENVEISAPFNPDEYSKVMLPSTFNSTTFNYPEGIWTRYLLLEYNGVHDTYPIDEFSTGGGKIYEVLFL